MKETLSIMTLLFISYVFGWYMGRNGEEKQYSNAIKEILIVKKDTLKLTMDDGTLHYVIWMGVKNDSIINSKK